MTETDDYVDALKSTSFWYFDDGQVEATSTGFGEYEFVRNTRPVPSGGWPEVVCSCGKRWPLYGTGLWIDGEHATHEMKIPIPALVYPLKGGGIAPNRILLLEDHRKDRVTLTGGDE